MDGPSLTYRPDNDPVFQATGAWYCGIPGATPCGFSMQDGTGGPDAGDAVVMRQSRLEPALRAYRAICAHRTPVLDDLIALLQHIHEFCHCKVRLGVAGVPLLGDLELYSHPNEAIPALQHSLRRGFSINSFTWLLRWRMAPSETWTEGLAWFGEQMRLKGIAL